MRFDSFMIHLSEKVFKGQEGGILCKIEGVTRHLHKPG